MFLARVTLASVLAFSFPSNTPWDKPANQWTAADTNKILEDSPWAPGKVTIEAKFTQKHTDLPTGLISDSSINTQNTNNIRGVQLSKGGTPDYYVKWMSAKTMRLALEKMHRMRTNAAGAQLPLKVEESPDYVIAIEGDEPMRIIRDAKEDLHDTVFVELDNGFTLDLASVQYIDGPDADPLRTEFHFLREIEGKPAIDTDSEKVIFHLRATAKKELPNRQNAIAIRVDFHPKEMRAQNVPDL
ncbi:MAG: hypothetical protein JSS69_02570 [Acidobacteria bacterium]|nr:hypothetical protein [Acidobacteriota bacterium]MBS1864778.1 hypothetical protein [Acidobacteriota bacterium]